MCIRSRSSFRVRLAGVVVLMLGGVLTAADSSDDYVQRIKPLLRSRCFSCHGALKQEAGLRLDSAKLMRTGGDTGPAIVSRDIAKSLLLKRVTAKDIDDRMPPKDEGEPLKAVEIDLIRDWINAGAPSPNDEAPESDPRQHWAFQPVVRPNVPAIKSAWVRNPIDAFLAAKHRERGLTPQPEAARIVLLRRLYMDLVGVPPTLEQIAAFEKDATSQRYDKQVTQLLDDPRHGERWGRHWMDIWRYSDWWGLGSQLRNSQKHIWHWRDWIIESLNNDTPYDEMVRLMLAADELHPNDFEKLRATGYLARNYFLFNRPQWMEETVEHVSKGFLGLTMNCAKCHDHKYDPLEQTDFYRMRAFFEPYHVRLDVVPGTSDLAVDGIPRVFDARLEEPTYLYIRGDEKNPDKSTAITPGVPAMLDFAKLDIQPVQLPNEAWQPQRRPWVVQGHLDAAKQKAESARKALDAANTKLATAKALAEKAAKTPKPEPKPVTQAKPTSGSGEVLIAEDFSKLDETHWKLFEGKWKHTAGRLEQQQDGPVRSVLRWAGKPPRDFDVTIRLTILGGSKWRSVTFGFDASPGDPTKDALASYHEKNVYVSAFAGGSKVHAAYNEAGKWHYPTGGAVRMLPIELNREYTLRIQARDRVLNASLNGMPVIACHTPIARRDGVMQLSTFDALAVIHEVKIASLDPNVKLRSPGNAPSSTTPTELSLDVVQAVQRVAEASLTTALAEVVSVERRADALRARWSDAKQDAQQETRVAAIRAVRQLAIVKAQHGLAVAQQGAIQAAGDKKAAANKAVKDAAAVLEKARKTLDAEIKDTDKFAEFVGAKWTPTRFLSSSGDDPAPVFSPQSTGRRSALAKWITDRRNPLTARVAVNHIWTRHMGRPLVPTVFDFGRNGTPPKHPQLLDWLAAEFMENGWSMKHLHRLIVTSSAYRMRSSSAGTKANQDIDSENHFWWRRVPMRLESQAVRDALLELAGTLDKTIGGAPVARAQQASSQRRSLYFFHSNNERNLFLTTFDEALVKDCYRREQSIVPQQALALTNSELVLDAASKIAARLTKDAPTKDAANKDALDEDNFIRSAFRVIVGINPTDAAIDVSRDSLNAWRKLPNGTETSARANFVWALINHNDFVTLR